ncbi:hypothetical protein [[Mycoplasma] gypis]|uniref:Uncharacterized protein n=1 Tax=[Mycoplasma] gypis TaxID=92404 RepID=A0ABZ2RW64_9BACT|nr:hypothetical protein [[Mycoplasma] gypis]MBN0919361.1 hypothetical protein [[Mycoplasma] gypis]
MKKQTKSLSIALWSLVGILSFGALSGIIYFTYYNAKVVHEKKYKVSEFLEDSEKISFSSNTYLNSQNAQEIAQKYQELITLSESELKNSNTDSIQQTKNEYISKFIKPNWNIRQKQNIEINYDDLNYDGNYLIINYTLSPKENLNTKPVSNQTKVFIWQDFLNFGQNTKLEKLYFDNYDSLVQIINKTTDKNDYYTSSEFRESIFNWFKSIVNQARPNLFPTDQWDLEPFLDAENNSTAITYTTKGSRNLLVIDYYFVSKDKSQKTFGSRFERKITKS